MKKRKVFSTAAAALVVVSMLSVLPMNAWAGSDYSASLAAGSVNTTELKKNLVIENDANIPATSFTFAASAGDAVEASSTTLAVLAGINPDKIKFGEEETADGNGTIAYAAQVKSASPTDNVTITASYPDANHYTATKSTTLDFSGCGFTEPGVYRYIITETGTNAGIINDSNATRTIDVYVEDATTTTKQLKIAGYVMYVGIPTAGPSNKTTDVTNTEDTSTKLEDGTTNKNTNGNEVSNATKSVGFQNTYSTHDLTFGKEVTGNQGSKDKYFKFTVNITDAVAGTIYDVDLTNADATSGTNAATLTNNQNQTNPTSITVGSDGTVSTNFYLQHGQSIVIKGIADGTAYTITETQEDYTPTAEVTGDTKKADGTTDVALETSADGKSASVADDGLTADTNVAFTNNRNGVIPTGVLISIAPAAIIGLLVIGGIIFLVAKNKRREAEED